MVSYSLYVTPIAERHSARRPVSVREVTAR